MIAPQTPDGNGKARESGRGQNGRFVAGNRFSKGNPLACRVAKLRTAALNAATQKDIRGILKKLTELALAGDVAAAREVLMRVLGPPVAHDYEERLAAVEQELQNRETGVTR